MVTASVAWGIMPVFTRFLYADGWTTNAVLFFRYLFSLAAVTIYIVYKRTDMRISFRQYLYLFIIGIPGYIGTSYLLYLSYHSIGIGLATMLHFIYPVLVVIFMMLFFKERFNLVRMLALLISLAGLYFLIGVKVDRVALPGVILALLSGLTYAFYVAGVSRPALRNIALIPLSYYFIATAAVVLFFVTFLTGHHYTFTTMSTVSILFISLFSTVLSFMCFLEGIKRIGASDSATLNTIEPIISVIAGVLIFGETLTPAIVTGCLLIITAVFILSRNIK